MIFRIRCMHCRNWMAIDLNEIEKNRVIDIGCNICRLGFSVAVLAEVKADEIPATD